MTMQNPYKGIKTAIIYGAGFGGERTYRHLTEHGIEVIAFIDDFKEGEYLGKPIIKLEDLNKYESDGYFIGSGMYERILSYYDKIKAITKKDNIYLSPKVSPRDKELILDDEYKICDNVYLFNTGILERQYKKILVIQVRHRGDFIMTIPALTKLKSRYPYSSIDIIVGSWNKEIAEYIGIFNNIYTFDYFKSDSYKSPGVDNKELVDFVNKLGYYDIVINFDTNYDTPKLVSIIKAGLKIGYETGNKDIDDSFNILLKKDQNYHVNIRSLSEENNAIRFLRLIDSIPPDVNDYIKLPDKLIQTKHIKNNKNIAIFPFAGNPLKDWGIYNYKKLIEKLSSLKDINTINIYLSSLIYKDVLNIEEKDKVRIYVGLDFESLINSLYENDIVIGNDSFGPHIASLLGLKTVVFSKDFVSDLISFPILNKSNYVFFETFFEKMPESFILKLKKIGNTHYIYYEYMDLLNSDRPDFIERQVHCAFNTIAKILWE